MNLVPGALENFESAAAEIKYASLLRSREVMNTTRDQPIKFRHHKFFIHERDKRKAFVQTKVFLVVRFRRKGAKRRVESTSATTPCGYAAVSSRHIDYNFKINFQVLFSLLISAEQDHVLLH